MSDRTYWHVPGRRAWHAAVSEATMRRAYCGRTGEPHGVELADRVPPNGHLCGSCARVIAARTDIEP